MNKQIKTIEDVREFINYLNCNEAVYNIDDDPADIINGHTGEPAFTDELCILLRQRVAEIEALGFVDEAFDMFNY